MVSRATDLTISRKLEVLEQAKALIPEQELNSWLWQNLAPSINNFKKEIEKYDEDYFAKMVVYAIDRSKERNSKC